MIFYPAPVKTKGHEMDIASGTSVPMNHEVEWYGTMNVIGRNLSRPFPNRFHAMDWANYDEYAADLYGMSTWAAMAHDHSNTLAHIDY